jgi:hypothetical protein
MGVRKGKSMKRYLAGAARLAALAGVGTGVATTAVGWDASAVRRSRPEIERDTADRADDYVAMDRELAERRLRYRG